MKIGLLNAFSERGESENKDTVGSYGQRTEIGKGIRAKILEKAKKAGVKLPILAFAQLAAIFEQKGFEVKYFENEFEQGFDLYIIHSSIVDFRKEIEFARRIKKETSAAVAFIGPFSGFKPELFLQDCDFVVRGEPESVFLKLVEGRLPKGLVESRPVKDLDSLPFPAWKYFPVEKYSYFPVIKKKPFLPVLASRGCVFKCNYCPYKAYYGSWRKRKPENVVREIKQLVQEFGVKGILFRDPLFDAENAKKIADRIVREGLEIEWACETHLNMLDEQTIDLLHESGLRAINVGIESSSEEVLKSASRFAAEKSRQERIIAYCDKKGVRVSAFYIIGLPADTEQTVLETIEYAKKLNTHVAQFSICTPFPGTDFYEQVKGKIYEKDFERFTSFNPVWEHKNLSRQKLLELREKAFAEYYFRPAYIAKFLKRVFLQ